MTDAQQRAAMDLLRDPKLIERVQADLDALGLAGEEENRLVCYLACVSRLLARPLSVLVQSSPGSGKTTLADTVPRLMPPERQVRVSALTTQALYYMGPKALRHKILVVAEQQGAGGAAYALKLLQSEGRLTIATAEKHRHTGRRHTEYYAVQGPAAMLLTTTDARPDAELVSRNIVLHTCETPRQTAAIQRRQRALYLGAAAGTTAHADALCRVHHDAQRLLEPLPVILPWADRLTFRADAIAMRRDHAKYLGLIAASALAHQYQRPRAARTLDGTSTPCVVATFEDLALANRLAQATLATARRALLPATRGLLERLHVYARREATQRGTTPDRYAFTQRQLRETLGLCDRTLRRHLARLVELEYVAVARAGCGNRRVYRLCDATLEAIDQPQPLGLVDVDALRAVSGGKEDKISGPPTGTTTGPPPV